MPNWNLIATPAGPDTALRVECRSEPGIRFEPVESVLARLRGKSLSHETSLCTEHDRILAGLGYRDYENYRARALWKRIRQRVLERDKHTCLKCNGKAEVVHHRSYSLVVLKGDDDEQLVSLCHGCHEVVEFDSTGARRNDTDKELELWSKCSITGYPAIKVDLRLKRPADPVGWKRMNWWQRTGWRAEYQYVLIKRKWPDNPCQAHCRAIFMAIQARTAESHWLDIPISSSRQPIRKGSQHEHSTIA